MTAMNYISKYLDSQRRLLEESVSQFLLESKHWPEDYMRTSFDKLKARFPEAADEDIRQLIDEMKNAIESIPAAHTLNFIKHNPKWWFILDYIVKNAGARLSSFEEVKKVIESAMPKIVKGLPLVAVCRDEECLPQNVKLLPFDGFIQLIDKVSAKAGNVEAGQNGNMYEVVPISSWQQMNELYGKQTGFNGKGEWCHTEGEDTWRSWTHNRQKMFFVIQRKDWRDIQPPDPKTVKTAFDEYGMSLIAILVDIISGHLKTETLRWNHAVQPPNGLVDHAFGDDWDKLSKAVGLDVESICYGHTAELRANIQRMFDNANKVAAEQLNAVGQTNEYTIPRDVKKYVTHIEIPSTVQSIGSKTFSMCEHLTHVDIPDSVTSIDEYAFKDCSSLTSISIPDSVTHIGCDAFHNCFYLTSIVLPSSIKHICKYTFNNCSRLTGISIPDTVRSIDYHSFANCKSLTSVYVPDSVTSIGSYAFEVCKRMSHIRLPPSIRYIENSTFFCCLQLSSIDIPSSVLRIEECAFGYCTNLTSATIPDSVVYIGPHAFQGCDSLQDITVPVSSYVASQAFYDCRHLTSIMFKGKTLSEVKDMINYPWGIKNDTVIHAELG